MNVVRRDKRSFGNIIAFCVLMLSLVCQFILAPIAAEQRVSSLRSLTSVTAHQDVMLICTGNTMQWASLEIYQTTGRIEFVSPPIDVPSGEAEVECANGALAKQFVELTIVDNSPITIWVQYLALKSVLQKRPYTSYAYQSALSRAPPLYSFFR